MIKCLKEHGLISGLSYLGPLICISLFVPVPYCLDYCSFVVHSEVRKIDSSSSILLSQDYFGYSEVLCASIQIVNFFWLLFYFWKLPLVIWQWLHWTVVCFRYYSHFHNIDSLNPRTWHSSPSVFGHLWFLSSVSYSFLSTDLLSP